MRSTGAASSTGTTCWTSNAGPTGYTNEQYTSAFGATVAGGTQMLTCSNTASDAAPIFSYEIIAPLGDGEIAYCWSRMASKLLGLEGVMVLWVMSAMERVLEVYYKAILLMQQLVETQIDYCGLLY